MHTALALLQDVRAAAVVLFSGQPGICCHWHGYVVSLTWFDRPHWRCSVRLCGPNGTHADPGASPSSNVELVSWSNGREIAWL